MRVDPHYIDGLVSSLNNSTLTEQKLTSQLSSGLRVSSLSDDAVAAGESSLLSAAISQDVSFVQTAASAQSLMQVSDTALSSVVSQLTSAISLGVEGNSGTQNASNLQALAQQLTGIRDQVVSLANTSYQGTYLFSGSQGNVQPYTVNTAISPAVAIYNGDRKVSTITTENGQKLQMTVAGSAVFSAPGADVMAALNNLIADFSSGTLSNGSQFDIATLKSGLDNVAQQQGLLGGSLQRIEAASAYAQTDATNRTATINALVAADPAQVATQLSAAETQNQALMTVIASVEKESLFSYMR